MIDPDVVGLLDGDGVAGRGKDLGNLNVANNDIALANDTKADALKSWIATKDKPSAS